MGTSVSAGNGRRPSRGPQSRDHRRDHIDFSRPRWPPSPACGLRPVRQSAARRYRSQDQSSQRMRNVRTQAGARGRRRDAARARRVVASATRKSRRCVRFPPATSIMTTSRRACCAKETGPSGGRHGGIVDRRPCGLARVTIGRFALVAPSAARASVARTYAALRGSSTPGVAAALSDIGTMRSSPDARVAIVTPGS